MLAFGIGGLIVGLLFTMVYAVIYIIAGGVPATDGSIISPLDAAAMYLAMCGVGGLIIGALRWLFRSALGTAMVGILGTVPLMFGSAVLYAGSVRNVDWLAVAVISVALGVPWGFALRNEYRSFKNEDPLH